MVWDLAGVLCMQSATILGFFVHISSISCRAKQFISRGCPIPSKCFNLCLIFDENVVSHRGKLDLMPLNDLYPQVLGLGTKLDKIRVLNDSVR